MGHFYCIIHGEFSQVGFMLGEAVRVGRKARHSVSSWWPRVRRL
jgi:hypothetical protein